MKLNKEMYQLITFAEESKKATLPNIIVFGVVIAAGYFSGGLTIMTGLLALWLLMLTSVCELKFNRLEN